MLSQKEWMLAEYAGNDEIAYKEYNEVASGLTGYFLTLFLPFFILYFILFKLLKWVLIAKIILGLFSILPVLYVFLFFISLYTLCFNFPKNKWLRACSFLFVLHYGLGIFQLFFYIKYVLLS